MRKSFTARFLHLLNGLFFRYLGNQVHAGVERQYAAYIGASVVAKLPLFTELCVFKEDWDEIGPDALEKWLTL